MTEWQEKPFSIEVKKGEEVAFCICGKSNNQPKCNGAHKGTGITPIVKSFDEDKIISTCGCLKSARLPFCDGAHRLP